mmetsp:Transcript_44797/g.115988  ORF Transcript_44797/g.115988 Transcript_44797/m.115988 type:complete len:286 (+) Transcript_44797:70-927(+)
MPAALRAACSRAHRRSCRRPQSEGGAGMARRPHNAPSGGLGLSVSVRWLLRRGGPWRNDGDGAIVQNAAGAAHCHLRRAALAASAVQGVGVGAAAWCALTAQPDESGLPPGRTPGVAHQPVVAARLVRAVAHQLDRMVDVRVGLVAPVKDTLLVRVPRAGVHGHGHRAVKRDRLHESALVVLGQVVVPGDVPHSQGVLLEGTAVFAVGVVAMKGLVRVAPLIHEAILQRKVKGKLRDGTTAAAGAAALALVGHTGHKLLHTERVEVACLQRHLGLERLCGRKRPA